MSIHLKPGGAFATDEFAALLGGLAETLGQRISATRILSYARLLGDVPLETIALACTRAAREGSTWIPSPGDLMRYVEPSADEAGLIAWSGLARAAGSVGAYAPLAIEDGATARALVAVFGSWHGFCSECGESPAWAQKRQEFLAAYKQARREAPPQNVVLGGLTALPQDGAVARLTAVGELERTDITRLIGEGHDATEDRADRRLSAHE